jgi:signal peptidase I
VHKWFKFLGWTFGILAVIVGVLRFTLFDTWKVPDDLVLGASIVPTLGAGDQVLLMTKGERGIGDLVRCPDPEDPQRWVIGRIVGLAGDRVRVEGEKFMLNDKRYDSVERCDEGIVTFPHPSSGAPTQANCSRVEIGGGWHFRATVHGKNQIQPVEHTVGPDRVYLLSDNRTFHDDSRDFGALPASSCKEKIVFRLWSAKGWSDHDARLTFIR